MENKINRVGAPLVALGVIIGAIKTLLLDFSDIAATLESSETIIFFLLSLFLIVSGVFIKLLSRRQSILCRPEALRLVRNNRAHLTGRDDDIESLIHSCRTHPLVFLVGASGAGKSALLQAGLLQDLRADAGLLPIYVETLLDGPSWEEAPWRAVSVALNAAPAFSAEARQKLGWNDPLPLAECSDALAKIQPTLGLTPLLILDQFDDYQNVHRNRFLQNRSWLQPDELCQQNGFWRSLRDHLEGEAPRLHVMIVTRRDAADGLGCVHFGQPRTVSLATLPPHEIGPLLARLTEPVDGNTVIKNPEGGWRDLCHRLETDLTREGRVLPQQLKVVLAALATLPRQRVTLRSYERAGGARGLEAQFIETAVQAAAEAHDQSRHPIRQALVALVDRTSEVPKATATREDDLLKIINEADREAARAVLEDLERREVMRQRASSDLENPLWQLDHDYLANAVLEAERRANRWTYRLEDGARALAAANGPLWTTWRNRWRALLPTGVQIAFLVDRLRSRFRYGKFRGYAWVSTLRFAPHVLVLAFVVFAGIQQSRQLQQNRIEAAFQTSIKKFNTSAELSDGEAQTLRAIAAQELAVRRHFTKLFLTDPDHARVFSKAPIMFGRALLGTSPSMHDWTKGLVQSLAVEAQEDWEKILPTAFQLAYILGTPEVFPIEAWLHVLQRSYHDPLSGGPDLEIDRNHRYLLHDRVLWAGFDAFLIQQDHDTRRAIFDQAVTRLIEPSRDNRGMAYDAALFIISRILTQNTAKENAIRFRDAAIEQINGENHQEHIITAAQLCILAMSPTDLLSFYIESNELLNNINEMENVGTIIHLLGFSMEATDGDELSNLFSFALNTALKSKMSDKLEGSYYHISRTLDRIDDYSFFKSLSLSKDDIYDLMKRVTLYSINKYGSYPYALSGTLSRLLSFYGEIEYKHLLERSVSAFIEKPSLHNTTIMEATAEAMLYRRPGDGLTPSLWYAEQIRRIIEAIPSISDPRVLKAIPSTIRYLNYGVSKQTAKTLAHLAEKIMRLPANDDEPYFLSILDIIDGLYSFSNQESSIDAHHFNEEWRSCKGDRKNYTYSEFLNCANDYRFYLDRIWELAPNLFDGEYIQGKKIKTFCENARRIVPYYNSNIDRDALFELIFHYVIHEPKRNEITYFSIYKDRINCIFDLTLAEFGEIAATRLSAELIGPRKNSAYSVIPLYISLLADRVSPDVARELATRLLEAANAPEYADRRASLYMGLTALAAAYHVDRATVEDWAQRAVAGFLKESTVKDLPLLAWTLEVVADDLSETARGELALTILDRLRTSSQPAATTAWARALGVLARNKWPDEFQARIEAEAFAALRNPLTVGLPGAVVLSVLRGDPPRTVRWAPAFWFTDFRYTDFPDRRAHIQDGLAKPLPEVAWVDSADGRDVIDDGLAPVVVWAKKEQSQGRLSEIDLEAPLSLEP
ncbi:ATP-binding protein [Roseospirillum parvum]|uniref:Novel STAND NTPase 1 domain-containing protein n=1 Tax=Roseospirillum parvum TaxID=83401 RepID=A0A1G8EXQ2_9PROT|nr:ATP-binding protein [Roseospirillum parvum]SDH74676.1 hypothetical protein SAMN05421742_11174 [Roseospirillum parvum]